MVTLFVIKNEKERKVNNFTEKMSTGSSGSLFIFNANQSAYHQTATISGQYLILFR
jgi:hypothetical protein